MHWDHIAIVLDKQQELWEAERDKEQAELENRVQSKVEELKERILNDPAFKVCKRDNAIKYLKTILKEYHGNEDYYDILRFFEFMITKYGDLRCNGYKAQHFIDELWLKAHEK